MSFVKATQISSPLIASADLAADSQSNQTCTVVLPRSSKGIVIPFIFALYSSLTATGTLTILPSAPAVKQSYLVTGYTEGGFATSTNGFFNTTEFPPNTPVTITLSAGGSGVQGILLVHYVH